jgi:hypothetical protein
MRRFALSLALTLLAACSTPQSGHQPSLAPRPAEAIDPRVPIPDQVVAAPVDPALVVKLQQLVDEARAGVPAFEARQAAAEQAAAGAGPEASESWVAAQQQLSLLIEQYGVTTRAAADIDELASTPLQTQRWIRPADQQAIAAAAAEVSAISDRQAAAIDRIKNQLAR